MQILDGKGKGYRASVNSENRLEVNAVAVTMEHHVNHDEGKAYTLLFDATPTGAGDCFFYLKNEDSDDLVLEGIWLWLAANEYVDIKLGDTGTPSGGGAITPINMNSGSGESADGTFQDGNDITGLSGGSTALRIYHASSQESIYWNFNQDIILPKNGVMTIYCQTGTTALAGMLEFHIHSAGNE